MRSVNSWFEPHDPYVPMRELDEMIAAGIGNKSRKLSSGTYKNLPSRAERCIDSEKRRAKYLREKSADRATQRLGEARHARDQGA